LLASFACSKALCDLVDEFALPLASGESRRSLIAFVADRPGHDLRYGIDQTRIATELDWHPAMDFESGLRDTVRWHLDNKKWWLPLVEANAFQRRGLT